MKNPRFDDVLEAASHLPIDAREELVEILHKRTIAERRSGLAKDIKDARTEYRKKKCKIAGPDDIINEIVS
ncbi:MAG: hypothetical protein GF401_19085 [Chitinivibrionales bacterium]|nr:hypothetical protein [Chitinivibrionales bacterium]